MVSQLLFSSQGRVGFYRCLYLFQAQYPVVLVALGDYSAVLVKGLRIETPWESAAASAIVAP